MRPGIPAGKEGTAGCAPVMVVAGAVWMAPVPVALESRPVRGETVVVAASGSVRVPDSVAVLGKEATAKEVSVRTNDKSEAIVMLGEATAGVVEGC